MRRENLVGMRFERLVVIKDTDKRWDNGIRLWECLCDCGNTVYTSTSHLKHKHTTSCGCLGKENLIKSITTHGMCGLSEHNIYRAMNQRCYNPNNKSFYRYGGKGIFVCRRWRKDFLNFYKDMGPKPTPKHSVDRIDNSGPYAPWNCRWATLTEQARNKTNNTIIQYKGESKLLVEWSEELDISLSCLCYRFSEGMSVEEAFETPVNKVIKYEYKGEQITLTEIARKIGMNERTFIQRVRTYNWPLEKAINTPTNKTCNWRLKAGIEHNNSNI